MGFMLGRPQKKEGGPLPFLLQQFQARILRLIQTPGEVAGEVSVYLRIIFGGFLATYWYNLCAAMLRSVGNTRTSLLFLAVSVIINTGLDILFFLHFRRRQNFRG